MTHNTPPAPDEHRFLAVKDVAARLKLSTKSVRRAIERKELAVHRFGGMLRVSEADLAKYISDSRS